MSVKFLNRCLPCVALLGALFMLAEVANAAHITGITVLPGSSGGEFGAIPANTIDGSGLDGSEPPQHLDSHNGTTGGGTSEYFLAFNDFDSAMDLTVILLDLNGTYDVDSLRFWNMNASGGRIGRGYTQVNVAFSSTGSTLPDFGAAQSFFPSIAPGTDGYTGELFPLTTAVGAKFALLTFGDPNTASVAFGETFGGDAFAGFSEIQFYVIPEPTTLSLMALSGLAMVGMRRKRVIA